MIDAAAVVMLKNIYNETAIMVANYILKHVFNTILE